MCATVGDELPQGLGSATVAASLAPSTLVAHPVFLNGVAEVESLTALEGGS